MLAEPRMESYLESIAEQVVDEDKIVTYKSLSRSLGIHVNTAKQLLHTYLTNEKCKNSFPISATYLVAGKVVDGSFNITVVNEADLKDTQSTFIEITSEHVYSIQKAKSLKEVKVLCGISKQHSNSEKSKLVITCSKSELKSVGGVKKKVKSSEETNKKVIVEALLPEKQTVTATEQNVKKIETTTSKESTSKSPKKTIPKGNQQKAQGNIQKPAGNIANLFAKAAWKNAGKPTIFAKSKKITSKNDLEETKIVKQIEPEKTESTNLEERSESKESLKRMKKGKKRKRIQMLTDSEESDNDDEGKIDIEEEEEEETPPCNINIEDEEREDVKEFIPRNKRKKRKLIDRTVMNEDGYLETKKEVVFETDSENEAEESKPTVKEPQKKLKVESPGKRVQSAGATKKQSSLLTFFKKS